MPDQIADRMTDQMTERFAALRTRVLSGEQLHPDELAELFTLLRAALSSPEGYQPIQPMEANPKVRVRVTCTVRKFHGDLGPMDPTDPTRPAQVPFEVITSEDEIVL